MPYVNPFDPTTPANNTAVGLGDDRIRELKAALIERLETLIVDIDTNPLAFIAGIIPGSAIANLGIGTAQLANDGVTYAKIQNVTATDKVLGRSTAGAGDVEEIACTAAGRALLDDVDAAAQRATLGLGALATLSAVGAAQITDGSVGLAELTAAVIAAFGPSSQAHVHKAAAQTFTTATPDEMTFDTVDEDPDSWWNVGVPTRLTVPAGMTGGRVFIGLYASQDVDPTGVRELTIQKNGTDPIFQVSADPDSSILSIAFIDDDVTAGDYYEIIFSQNSGSNHDVSTSLTARMGFMAIKMS